ncbi:hypothetical protein U7230_04825 [Carboxydochorda subterranea]|uniref:Uncharacterized protein n=1 Tax=Carboxydichorda subterranea TaxID=3109565 RepID=A0ABZ1C069_9FIRM|nr:hypothetical protein [Limnochorda sp. L945t]WRP18334.1 hypothetical protein U7230_04825 [Limnochorda sp. L945t]
MGATNGRRPLRRFFSIGLTTAAISAVLSISSSGAASTLGVAAAVGALLLVIATGILFDVIGVAATAASERNFHAMAADKVPGAPQAIWIVRNADRVANFANDVMGDVAGTLSGALGAAIVAQLVPGGPRLQELWGTAAIVAGISGLTVGGKAAFKAFAIGQAEAIVFRMGRLLASLERLAGRSFVTGVGPARASASARRPRVAAGGRGRQ